MGTRVPFRNVIDYLERGYSLEEFLNFKSLVLGPWFFVLGPSCGPRSVVRAADWGRRTKNEGRTKDQAPRTKHRLLHRNENCSSCNG